MVSGLAHLHDLGIIHRDLKPQNVLIIKEKTVCAKLSDMGISKRLLEDRSSLGHYATGKYLHCLHYLSVSLFIHTTGNLCWLMLLACNELFYLLKLGL